MRVPVCLSLNDLSSPNNVLFHLLSNAAQALLQCPFQGGSPETMCSSLSLALFTSSHDDGPHTRVVTHTPGLKQTLQYLGWHPLSPWFPSLTRPQGFEPPRLPFLPKFPYVLLTTISPHPQLSTWSSCRHHTQSVSKHTCYASHDFPPFWLTEPIRTKCISLFQFSRFLSRSELPKTCVLFHWTTTHFARCKGEKMRELNLITRVPHDTQQNQDPRVQISDSESHPLLLQGSASPSCCPRHLRSHRMM